MPLKKNASFHQISIYHVCRILSALDHRLSSVFHVNITVQETQVMSIRNIHLCKTDKVRKTESMRKKHTRFSSSRPLHFFLSSAHERCSSQVLLDLDEFRSAARALLLTFLLFLQLENMYRHTLRKLAL